MSDISLPSISPESNSSQLLAQALARDPRLKVVAVGAPNESSLDGYHPHASRHGISADFDSAERSGMQITRAITSSHPAIYVVMLLEANSRKAVTTAFHNVREVSSLGPNRFLNSRLVWIGLAKDKFGPAASKPATCSKPFRAPHPAKACNRLPHPRREKFQLPKLERKASQ
jgi:hypothetical protein